MSYLREQNPQQDTGGYSFSQLSSLLPKMQARMLDWSKAATNKDYNRASRTDTEPMNCKYNYRPLACVALTLTAASAA